RPDLLVCSFSGCYVYVKWWEALAESYGVPLFMFDVPYMREETPRKEDIAYLVSQLWELVHLLEKRTGRAFDLDELKRVLAESRRAEDGWVEFLRAGRLRPSPIEAYFESIFYMFPINVLRGTPGAADFYDVVNEEVR
ncbi:2-hydroxyglutaryl-CoA dehydratase, D-component, partial [mine drainage metagenome]